MYVAITRAKEKLYITSAKKRMIYGQEQASVQSRFISEIMEELIDFENVGDIAKNILIPRFLLY